MFFLFSSSLSIWEVMIHRHCSQCICLTARHLLLHAACNHNTLDPTIEQGLRKRRGRLDFPLSHTFCNRPQTLTETVTFLADRKNGHSQLCTFCQPSCRRMCCSLLSHHSPAHEIPDRLTSSGTTESSMLSHTCGLRLRGSLVQAAFTPCRREIRAEIRTRVRVARLHQSQYLHRAHVSHHCLTRHQGNSAARYFP